MKCKLRYHHSGDVEAYFYDTDAWQILGVFESEKEAKDALYKYAVYQKSVFPHEEEFEIN